MPKAAFKDLWATVKQDKIWTGYVKNRKPSAQEIEEAHKLYQTLKADEVRKLAKRTQKSLAETTATTNVLIQSINDSSETLNQNAEEVNDISDEVNNISSKIDDIIHTLSNLTK